MKVSVIIPVKDEAASIASLLDDLLSQTLPADEVVITDGGSTDLTCAVIQSYIDGGYPVKLVRTEHAYPGRGRNLAIAEARNEFVAMIDAGMRADRCWLEKLTEPVRQGLDVDVVYGHVVPVRDTLFEECAAAVYAPAPEQVEGKPARHRYVPSSLIRKSVWNEVGGFPDLRVGEDLIFMDRIERGGYKITHAPHAVVHWFLRSGFGVTFRHFTMASRHALRAGFWRTYHRRVVMMHVAGFGLVALGLVQSLLWLLVLEAAIDARVVMLLVRKRGGRPVGRVLDPRRLFLTRAIMHIVDFAILSGLLLEVLGRGQVREVAPR